MTDALAAGRPIKRLAVPLAAWMAFIVRQAKAGLEIIDPLADPLAALGRAATGEAEADVSRFLALDAVFPAELARNKHLRQAVAAAYQRGGQPS